MVLVMLIARRSFLIGLAVPAIVRVESLMPLRGLVMPIREPARRFQFYLGDPIDVTTLFEDGWARYLVR